VSNLLKRVRKLEARLTDFNGLVPHSKEWFEYWEGKIDQFLAGDKSVDFRGMTLEFVDALIAKGKEAANKDEGAYEPTSNS